MILTLGFRPLPQLHSESEEKQADELRMAGMLSSRTKRTEHCLPLPFPRFCMCRNLAYREVSGLDLAVSQLPTTSRAAALR